MTATEFLEWSERQPDGKHYELDDGIVVESLSERAAHARVKLRTAHALGDAIRAAGVSCEEYGDGMAVKVNEHTVFEPDAAVRCGTPLDGNAICYRDPVIVVEIILPSTAGRDRTV